MRGKQRQRTARRERTRIIPARAGQTALLKAPTSAVPDHPRACGANHRQGDMPVFAIGSSPRVRGKRRESQRMIQRTRIIPARAGQTPPRPCRQGSRTDHPRACGANSFRSSSHGLLSGSSPRVRGKRYGGTQEEMKRRIIPARAGQTAMPRSHPLPSSDHPRACGANPSAVTFASARFGSSPRVRGKPGRIRWRKLDRRIIPARAGQTSRFARSSVQKPDHPRACGANFADDQAKVCFDGSSPRVRGKLFQAADSARVGRIIPARAGQTQRWSPLPPDGPDHPRACGANVSGWRVSSSNSGSSPRVRGKQHVADELARRHRIIPARAGQTVRFYAKTLERWTLNNWIRTVAPIFVLLFLLPVIGQNAYIERHYSNQSFSWFSKLHYASAFDLSLVA